MTTGMYRILDANFNRAREGLRVVEEYLRFIRQDPRGAWLLKRWRHEFRQMAEALGPQRLLAARAADSDVGKDLVSPSQAAKQDPAAVTAAGLKRLQESLRVIEEYSASLEPSVSGRAGRMRFEVYQFERELFTGSPRDRFSRVRLYLLIGSDFCPVAALPDLADRLLEAGVDCLQLREKTLPDGQVFALAEELARRCRRQDKVFIVNDRPDIARAVGADGVHVGQGDLPVAAVRQVLDPDRMVGLSTHNVDQLERAIELSPTYIAIGPAFDTTTKPHEPTAGLEYVATAVGMLRDAGLPEVAIGGITPENLPRLMERGVRRIAVCSAILAAADPVGRTKEFSRLLATQNKPAR